MKRFASVIAVLLLLISCSPKTVVVTERVTDYQHDTIIRVDSVKTEHLVYKDGDTIRVVDMKTVIKYRDRIEVVNKVDSIPYEVQVVKEVRVRNSYDRFTSCGFWILLCLVVGFVAIKLYLLIKH